MPRFSWYQMDVDRWRNSTSVAKMSFAERGAYREMLDYQFMHPQGYIPNEPCLFYQYARGTPEAWEVIKTGVLAMFKEVEGGKFISNETAREKWLQAQEKCEQLRQLGSRGGKAKAAKYKARASAGTKTKDKPAEAKSTDPRRESFLDAIDQHLKATIPDESARPQFHPHVTTPLDRFLKDHDKLTVEGFAAWLKNRAASDKVNWTDLPRTWLPKLPKYASSPLDEWGKPKRETRRPSAQTPQGPDFVAAQRTRIEQATADRAKDGAGAA